MQRLLPSLVLTFLFSACPEVEVPPIGPARCEVDLAASGHFTQGGTGARATVVTGPSDFIGGEGATARKNDILLKNDRVRVIIEQPSRVVGPFINGGGIIDADLVRSEGGRDIFGRMNLIYTFGRISSTRRIEVLADGSTGGPAVVAATGEDAPHDILNLPSLVKAIAGLNVDFVVDPNVPAPVRSTTYYVLSPGESRVRVLTAFCNDGERPLQMPLIEVMDVGGFEAFNPGPCSGGGLGLPKLDPNNAACLLAPSRWFGVQGEGLAYGFRAMSLSDLTMPAQTNALLGYGGVLGTLVEGESISGVLAWSDPSAVTRPGSFVVPPGKQGFYLRDFVIERDLMNVRAVFDAADGEALGQLQVTATLPGGAPAAGARISVAEAGGDMVGVYEADAQGKAGSRLKPGSYTLSAALWGRAIGPEVTVNVQAGAIALGAVELGASRTLHVSIKDIHNAPSPGKVTVYCEGGTCPFNEDTYSRHLSRDKNAQGAAVIDFVGVSGEIDLQLPPGEYRVVVSRGPEYSTWPDTWPTSGAAADLRDGDVTLSATVGRIVDTPGWISSDLHVHAWASSDSATPNVQRAANFLAEGVDVLLSTDHEVIVDFAPVVSQLGASHLMATMIGEELTTFSHGHYNVFPVTMDPNSPNGGAFDHGNGERGAEFRPAQFFPLLKQKWPDAVTQLNHPRGGMGSLSLLRVDTDTLATKAPPENFFMDPAPDATVDDTKLLGDGFDVVEIANGPSPSLAVMNDWMTFLSRGTVRTSSGVSDTHDPFSDQGAYARTWAYVGDDSIAAFSPAVFAHAMRNQRAFCSNGPILGFTAQKLEGGNPVGEPVGIGGTLSVASGDTVEFTIDVQGLEWMQLNRIELYTHSAGREAHNGETNAAWPENRIAQVRTLDPGAAPVEPVPGTSDLRRVHYTEKFQVTVTADTWFVGMARGTSGRDMRPLHTGLPFAWSNAILIDADGSGAYDDFPLKPGQPLKAKPPAPKGPPRVATIEDAVNAIMTLLSHSHE